MRRSTPGSESASHQFPSTHWSQLRALGDQDRAAFRQGFSFLIDRYWKPAFSYVRNLRRDAQPAEILDLTQEFFTRLLESENWQNLGPEAGSFRGYLKKILKNFSIEMFRSDARRAPREGARLFRFQLEDGQIEPQAPGLSPEEAFDRRWARDILAECIAQLEAFLLADGKQLHVSVFRDFYLLPDASGARLRGDTASSGGADTGSSYEDIARRYHLKLFDVTNILRHARIFLRDLLLNRVREYLGPDEDPEEELKFLLSQ